jgi:hypothetical protein
MTYEVEIFRLDKRHPGGMKSVEIKRYIDRSLAEVESLNPRRPYFIVMIKEIK